MGNNQSKYQLEVLETRLLLSASGLLKPGPILGERPPVSSPPLLTNVSLIGRKRF